MVSKMKFAYLKSLGRKHPKRAKTHKFNNVRANGDLYDSSSDEDSIIEKTYPIDPWHISTGEAYLQGIAINPNLSLNHPYGGSNYGRFETHLKFLQPLHSTNHHAGTPKSRASHPAKLLSPQKGSKCSALLGFLDLPKEIRLMVYECLNVRTRHDIINKEYTYKADKKIHRGQTSCTLVTKSVPGISILATCKTISDEAWPILVPLLNDVTYKSAKVILDARYAAETIASPASPLAAIIGYYAALKERPLLTYREFLAEAQESFDPWPNAYEAALLNNGYYQDYPFHLYPWIFEDNKFRNSAKKLAHQLVSYDKSGSENSLPFEIALTNNTGLTSNELDFSTEMLHSVLGRWFATTRVKFYVQPVSKHGASDQNMRPTGVWTIGPGDHCSKVVWRENIDEKSWEDNWAEGERYLS